MVVESSIVDCSAVRILGLVGQRFLLLRRRFEAGGEREGEREDIADEPSPLIDDEPPLLNTISGEGDLRNYHSLGPFSFLALSLCFGSAPRDDRASGHCRDGSLPRGLRQSINRLRRTALTPLRPSA